MQLNVLFAQVTILIFHHETNALQVFLSASVRSSCRILLWVHWVLIDVFADNHVL